MFLEITIDHTESSQSTPDSRSRKLAESPLIDYRQHRLG